MYVINSSSDNIDRTLRTYLMQEQLIECPPCTEAFFTRCKQAVQEVVQLLDWSDPTIANRHTCLNPSAVACTPLGK